MLSILDKILGGLASWILIKFSIILILISKVLGFGAFYFHWLFLRIIKMAIQTYFGMPITV
jgi:hypothetical protein